MLEQLHCAFTAHVISRRMRDLIRRLVTIRLSRFGGSISTLQFTLPASNKTTSPTYASSIPLILRDMLRVTGESTVIL